MKRRSFIQKLTHGSAAAIGTPLTTQAAEWLLQILLQELEEQKLIDVHLTDLMGYGFTPWRKIMPDLFPQRCQVLVLNY